METYLDIILTALIAAIISAAVIWILTMKHKQEQRKWEKTALDNYARGQDDASRLLKETYDKIEEDRNRLEIYSDRELLMQIMLSLGSYGRRLDRMDDKLKILTHYKSYIEDMNAKARSLTQHFAVLENDISATNTMIHRLRNTIGETVNGITTLIEEVESIKSVHNTVTEYISQLSQIEMTLQQLQSSTADIVSEMSTVLDTHNQSPMKKLKVIEMEINGLNLLVSILQENMAEISAHSEKIEKSLEKNSGIPDDLKKITDSLDRMQTHFFNTENK